VTALRGNRADVNGMERQIVTFLRGGGFPL
jgi:hypothetical protein